ncbi:MAG: Inorganic triphosphatase [Verrucomicrobia subdivision 3 bacterium]|nr:Inorganic triphosphatase [Limisphaerales bacterium]MCS1413854.1 Inorganic triphosphatase [Limisphaerales bacterium]
MGIEIERKFLVISSEWRSLVTKSLVCCQGYISDKGKNSIRVRMLGDQGFLTIKGPRTGLRRAEFEYKIPLADAKELLASFCHHSTVTKIRHQVPLDSRLWEVDEFSGENTGLTLAEVELDSENQSLRLPGWVGKDVSFDNRYFNANLAKSPFSTWQPESV